MISKAYVQIQQQVFAQVKNSSAIHKNSRIAPSGENIEVVWAEFTTLSLAILLDNTKMLSMQMAISKVENTAQVSSC